MRNFNTGFIIGLICIFTLPLLVSAQTGTLCNQYQSGSTPPAGYGASWNPLTSAKELLLSGFCYADGSVNYTVGHPDGPDSRYIYKIGYYYADGWQPMTFTGTFAEGSTDWLVRQGTLTRSSPPSGDHFWVGYVCQLTGTAWKCGCRDQACATNYWQIQGVTYPSGGGTTEGTTNRNTCTDREYTLKWSSMFTANDNGDDALNYIETNWKPLTYLPSGTKEQIALRMRIAGAPDGSTAFRVFYPKAHGEGKNGINFANAPLGNPGPRAACLRYKVYWESGFDPGLQGGKTPGLWGGTKSSPYGGCVDVPGNDGWTMRLDFAGYGTSTSNNLRPLLYGYYANKNSSCGEITIGTKAMPRGAWVSLEEEVVMNDVGKSNGVGRLWMNSEFMGEQNGIMYRTIQNIGVRGIFFSNLFGGSIGISPKDQYAWFKDFELYAK